MAIVIGRRQRPQLLVNRRIRPRTPGFRTTTWAEGRALFDAQARKELGISGEEFLRRWDASEYRGMTDETTEAMKINRLIMLMPFARPIPVES